MTTPEIEEIVSNAGVLHRQLVLNVKNHPEVYDPVCKVLENWVREKLTSLTTKHKEEVKKVIGQHNARILNSFQLEMKPDMPMVCYDERIALIPAIEKATKETLQALSPTTPDKQPTESITSEQK